MIYGTSVLEPAHKISLSVQQSRAAHQNYKTAKKKEIKKERNLKNGFFSFFSLPMFFFYCYDYLPISQAYTIKVIKPYPFGVFLEAKLARKSKEKNSTCF
jgi:hypothetical protein